MGGDGCGCLGGEAAAGGPKTNGAGIVPSGEIDCRSRSSQCCSAGGPPDTEFGVGIIFRLSALRLSPAFGGEAVERRNDHHEVMCAQLNTRSARATGSAGEPVRLLLKLRKGRFSSTFATCLRPRLLPRLHTMQLGRPRRPSLALYHVYRTQLEHVAPLDRRRFKKCADSRSARAHARANQHSRRRAVSLCVTPSPCAHNPPPPSPPGTHNSCLRLRSEAS